MARDPIRIVRNRRDQLSRDVAQQKALLDEMQAALRECNRLLDEMLATQKSQTDLDAELTLEHVIKPRELRSEDGRLLYGGSVPDVILAALRELNRNGDVGADSSIVFAMVRKVLPNTKPNTFRVAANRLRRGGKIVREGKFLWLPKAKASVSRSRGAQLGRELGS